MSFDISKTKMPLVTVITLIYNTGNYVIEALQTIREQDYPAIQNIIIDDCSNDNSKEIVSEWIERNKYDCEFIKHEQNLGITKSLNDGLERAKGKYVTFLSDDLFLPNKLIRQVNMFESLPDDYGVLYSDIYMRGDSGNDLGTLFHNYIKLQTGPEGNVFEQLFVGNFVHGSACLIKRECFEIVGYFDESLVVEDIDMYLRIALKFKFKFDNQICAVYRIHENSLLQTIGMKVLEQNLKSLSPFRNYSDRTFAYFICYFDDCLNRFYSEKYVNWKIWFRKRWHYKRDLKSIFFFLLALLNMNTRYTNKFKTLGLKFIK